MALRLSTNGIIDIVVEWRKGLDSLGTNVVKCELKTRYTLAFIEGMIWNITIQ